MTGRLAVNRKPAGYPGPTGGQCPDHPTGLRLSSCLPRDEALAIPDLIRTKINLLPPEIAEIRVVNIEGIDQQADGGTHVANTREVGRVRIVGSENKGKGNKRLQIVVE